MNISQPENPIKLPKDLEKAIEKGRNTVTLLESESKRLDSLIKTLKADVITADNALNIAKTQLSEIESSIASSSKEKSQNEAILSEQQCLIDANIVKMKEQMVKIEQNEETLSMLKQEQEKIKNKNDEITQELEKNAITIEKREYVVSEKEKKIKEFANSL